MSINKENGKGAPKLIKIYWHMSTVLFYAIMSINKENGKKESQLTVSVRKTWCLP
jgi:hypothetical protein